MLFFSVLLCTFFCFFICEAKKQKKDTKEKKENTLFIVSLVDVNRLDKSSNELLDYLISRASSEATSEAKRFGVAENSHSVKTPEGRRNITCFLFLYSTFFLFAS